MSARARPPSFLPVPHRIPPRLLRPVLLLLLAALAYLAHRSLYRRSDALARPEQAPGPGEGEGEGEGWIGIQPVGEWPDPVDVRPEWLDQPEAVPVAPAAQHYPDPPPSSPPPTPTPAPSPSPESDAEPARAPAAHTPPWLPNPLRPPMDFPRLAASPRGNGHYYMYNTSIPELSAQPGPSTHPCVDADAFGPLLLVGVFSTPDAFAQRAVMRALQQRGLNARSPPVEFKFVLGRANASLLRAQEEKAVLLEQAAYGDVVRLDTDENMDDGKTFAFFRWAAQLPVGSQPRFVMKADSDTFLVLPNVLASFSSLPCAAPTYWGTWWGSCGECYPLYMRGLAYALSWPLVAWLGAAPLRPNDTRGMEDIRTGGWLTSLPPGEAVRIVDWGVRMGDWYGQTIPHDVHTVALHAMKSPQHWLEVAQEMTGIWKREGWEYTWPPTEG